jgi:hypothetical protein
MTVATTRDYSHVVFVPAVIVSSERRFRIKALVKAVI